MNALRRLTLALLAILGLRRAHERHAELDAEPQDHPTLNRQTGGPSWAEPALAAMLLLAGALAVTFVVVLLTGGQTQLLGLTIGGSLALLAISAVFASEYVLPREEAAEPHAPPEDPQAQANATADLVGGLEGVSRRRLLGTAAGTCGAAIGAAAIAVPLTQAGPGSKALGDSPWRRGVRLVDDQGEPIRAEAVTPEGFTTAFPEGSDPRELAAPVVLVRLADPSQIQPPRGREGWSPEGILAFSKICTHAGCAISLFRSPKYEPTTPGPALVCPCHYSTFDVTRGAEVVFGPAGRPLPQLPLTLQGDGTLVAGGPLSGSVGPAWWGTERSA